VSYFFHPAAETEHLESVAFYESRQPGLGASYLTAFEEAMSAIVETPKRYRIRRSPDIRRKNITKFPYYIIYRETPDGIQVLAVAHNRRQPGYWLKRTAKR